MRRKTPSAHPPYGSAQTLLDSHRLRILARSLGISKVDASSEAIAIQFVPNPPIDPLKIITMIQSKPRPRHGGAEPSGAGGGAMRLLPQTAGFASNVSQPHIKMAEQDRLRIELKYGDLHQRVLAIRNFFAELR